MLDNLPLAHGDAVTVTRLDRLAHSTRDVFAIVKRIVADTGTGTGRLMIALLGGLGDVERDLIRTRTAEGRSRAQKRGQHMGRPPKLTRRRRRRRPYSAARRTLRCMNSPGATTSGYPPFAA
jgi:DNA invertase Pin-like site-specific DNA recombinase